MLKDEYFLEFSDLSRTITYTRIKDDDGWLPFFSVRRNGELIGLVSERYKPIRVEPIVDRITSICSDTEVEVEDRGNNFVNVVIKLKSYKFKEQIPVEEELNGLVQFDYSGVGSSVYPAIFISNSYNGSSTLTIDSGLYRTICSNGLVHLEELIASNKARHIGKTDIDVEEIERFVEDITSLYSIISNPNLAVETSQILDLANKIGLGNKAKEKYINPIIQNLEKIRMWTAVNLFTYLMVRVKSIANHYQSYMSAQKKLNKFILDNI